MKSPPAMQAMALAVVAACLGIASWSDAAALLPGPLVNPEWLEAHRNEVVVLDVRDDPAGFTSEPRFTLDGASGQRTLAEPGGHVPGALMIEFAKLRTERTVDGRSIPFMLPEARQFEAVMRAAGVPRGKPIVIVTQGTAPEEQDEAARAYWSIKYYGGVELAILDGGMARWLAEGHAVESTLAASGNVPAGDWTAGTPHPEIVADSTQVADALRDGVQLLDARPAAFYFGLQKKPAVAAAGHISGALDFPLELQTAPMGIYQHFLSATQYRSMLAAIGVRADRPIITYCNTGHLAAGAWFIASELLGNPHVALYDGSMLRWAAEGRPVVAAH